MVFAPGARLSTVGASPEAESGPSTLSSQATKALARGTRTPKTKEKRQSARVIGGANFIPKFLLAPSGLCKPDFGAWVSFRSDSVLPQHSQECWGVCWEKNPDGESHGRVGED